MQNFLQKLYSARNTSIDSIRPTSFPLLRTKSISSAVKLAIVMDFTRCGGFKPRLQAHNYAIYISVAAKKKFNWQTSHDIYYWHSVMWGLHSTLPDTRWINAAKTYNKDGLKLVLHYAEAEGVAVIT